VAKHDIAYQCGCKGSIHIIPLESRIAYLEAGVCMECYKFYFKEAISRPTVKIELPPLTGSEKEIAWANSLRIHKLSEIETEIANIEKMMPKEEYRQILIAIDEIQNKTAARQWILWRHYSAKYIVEETLKAIMAVPTAKAIEDKEAAQAKEEAIKRAALAEATMRPQKAVSNIAAEIYIDGDVVSIFFPKPHDAFNEIVRSLGYSWKNGLWKRKIDKFAGTPEDRAVELGHTLLANGFFVRFFDEALRSRIAKEDFEPEQTRWIMKRSKGDYVGWFAIRWGSAEDFYDAARRIADSRYSKPNIMVPPEQFEQVLDFAERYDFRLSEEAQIAMQEARKVKESMLLVQAKPRKWQKAPAPSASPKALKVPNIVEIDDDLRDE